jgi:hypothetical protein
MRKQKTNNDMMKALMKELDFNPVYMALLRERIIMIMDKTIKNIKENPAQWENPLIHSSMYIKLDELVKKHIGFDEKNIHEKY